MFLKKLSLISFKNIGEAALEFDSRINCFVGGNGAGKTNILDAVYYLSMCKSSLSMTDGQCVNHDGDFFVIDGEYQNNDGKKETVVSSFKPGAGKNVKRNGKEYQKLSDHIGTVPLVMISPGDTLLITDAADERRRYLNLSISQLNKAYMAALLKYNHILSERNKLLKSDSGKLIKDIIPVLDEQLCESGTEIFEIRKRYLEKLAPLAAEYYKQLSDDRESVELSYRSELTGTDMRSILDKNRQKDYICQFTSSGIHRDDVKMKIGDMPLRKYGSQGQQKSFIIAMKLAQYKLVESESGKKPLLLLDDIFDKLDGSRVERLLEMVSKENFGQIFITDCNSQRLEVILEKGKEAYSIYCVDDGKITRQ